MEKVGRRRATIANLITQYVTMGWCIISGIVLVPLYLKHIDYKLYGAWLSTGGILAWLFMADPGLTDVIRQQVAQLFGSQKAEQTGEIIGTGSFCMVVLGILPVLASLGIAPFLPGLFGLEDEIARDLSLSFVLSGLSVSLVIISGCAFAVQQGLQKNISLCIIIIIGQIINLVVTVYMLLAGYGVISIPAGFVAQQAFALFGSWICAFYSCYRTLHIRMRISKSCFFNMASLTGYTLINKVSFAIFSRCDVLVIGLLLGVEATPIYVFTGRSWDFLKMFLNKINVAFMPGLAHLHGEGSVDEFRTISQRLMRLEMYTSAIGVGVCAGLNKTFVSLWVGKNLYAGRAFDLAVGLGTLATVLVWTINKVLFASGNIKKPAIIVAVQNVFMSGVLILLVWLWGILGAALSTIISFGVVMILYFAREWVKAIRISSAGFCKELWHFIKAFGISIIIVYLISLFMVKDSWLWFISSVLISSLLTTLAVYVLDKQFRIEVAPIFAMVKKGFLRNRIL